MINPALDCVRACACVHMHVRTLSAHRPPRDRTHVLSLGARDSVGFQPDRRTESRRFDYSDRMSAGVKRRPAGRPPPAHAGPGNWFVCLGVRRAAVVGVRNAMRMFPVARCPNIQFHSSFVGSVDAQITRVCVQGGRHDLIAHHIPENTTHTHKNAEQCVSLWCLPGTHNVYDNGARQKDTCTNARTHTHTHTDFRESHTKCMHARTHECTHARTHTHREMFEFRFVAGVSSSSPCVCVCPCRLWVCVADPKSML